MAALTPRRLLGGLAVLTFALACSDGLGPDSRTVRLIMVPSFAAVAGAETDVNPASLVDNIRVVIVDAAGDTVIDRIIEWPLDQDTLSIDLFLEVKGSGSFDVELEGRVGDVILFHAGPFNLHLSAGSGPPQIHTPVLEYVGPEASLHDVAIDGAPALFVAGSTVQLGATGLDAGGAPAGTPIVLWSSLDTLAATVDADGLVSVRHDAGRAVQIVARVAFRSLADTVTAPLSPATLELSADTDTIRALGFDATIARAVLGADGGPVTRAAVAWTSTDPAVVRVLDRPGPGGAAVVRAVAPGSAVIVGTSGVAADSVTVTVHQAVAAAAPTPSRAIIPVGDELAMQAVAVDAGGSLVEGRTVVWSATGAVTVDAAGLVQGVAAGDGAVVGTIEGQAFPSRIQVTDPGVAGATERIAIGDLHACRIEALEGDLYCWGVNSDGQLGTGDLDDRDQPARVLDPALRLPGDRWVSVAAGGFHTCAVLETGAGHRTYCWGRNELGQLGDGTTASRDAPGDPLTGPELVSVVAGGVHTCGLDAAGEAWCWGYNRFGQLGTGAIGGEESQPTLVDGGLTFTSLAAGWLHSCGIASDGALHCWGRGGEGALGTGATDDAGSPAAVAGGHTFSRVAAGAAHTCAIAAGAAYCWGYNSAGQTGTGSALSVQQPVAVAFPDPTVVDGIVTGWMHSCARATDGTVHCWGGNDGLQLARVDLRISRTPVQVFLGFPVDALGGGGTVSCAIAGDRTVCWGGIPRDYLGRAPVIPPAPVAEMFATR